MANFYKAVNRDRKRKKRIYGMRRSGDSIKTIQKALIKRRELILRRKRKIKESL